MEGVEAVSAERAMGLVLDALVPARMLANQGDAHLAEGTVSYTHLTLPTNREV